jgi:hypothetical protein
MRRVIALMVVAALLLLTSAPPAQAGRSTDIALGLASFAVFNQVVAPLFRPHYAEAYRPREVVYTTVVQPAVVQYYPAAVVAAPTPAPTVIQYPHGRYELQLHGSQYVWVWIPNVPPPPPPPPAPTP